MPHSTTETRCRLCNRPVDVEDFFQHLRVVHDVAPDERTVADVPAALGCGPLEAAERQHSYVLEMG